MQLYSWNQWKEGLIIIITGLRADARYYTVTDCCVASGFKQGCVLSPLLFLLVVNLVKQNANVRKSGID